MEARRISVIIKYNNKDISVDISKYLKSISYTDNLSGEADDLQITLEDKAGLWQSTWIPEKGALLDVMLQQKYWQTLSELPQSLRLGLFEIDEITSSGYPSEVQIKAVSVPDNNTLRGTERSRSWEKAKLQVIANDIASAAGMSLFWDTEENPVLDRAEQTEQSDLSFLYAICKDKGLALKISDKKIIIFDEAKYEAEKAKITIVKPGTVYKKESGMKYLFVGTGYSLRTKIRDIYAACRVSYQQGSSKSNIEATYTVAGKKGKTLQVNEQVESVAEALNLAKKRLREKNKDEVTGSLNMLGNFVLLSGVTVNLLGFGAFDDKYLITRASHDIGSGYTTNIDVRRCLNGY
ncbi:phage late control D family protein [uncultured Phascolarctobacterium sp.]|uniref:phage late control D family protein n=1 Tax=uncultured Phascolarctobacterium sp. TaxID=512296 RepID=UPI0025926317|nr:transcriptional regulator [uncultured Phascolarctobacterium sp.]